MFEPRHILPKLMFTLAWFLNNVQDSESLALRHKKTLKCNTSGLVTCSMYCKAELKLKLI